MTTARQIWDAMLTELSKVNAPSLLLHEFNYYINKAISQYVNKRYNIYDVNLQTTDDLRVLKATAILPVTKVSVTKLDNFKNMLSITADGKGTDEINLEELSDYDIINKLLGATYEVTLPDDYLHALNCICIYKLTKNAENCYDEGDIIEQGATRLTSDSWSVLINDYYNRPSPWKPYYYIHNINSSNDLPTNPVKYKTYSPEKEKGEEEREQLPGLIKNILSYSGTDLSEHTPFPDLQVNENGSISIVGDNTDQKSNNLRKNPAYTRLANASKVRCEIRYGKDDSIYKLQAVLMDYIKAPERIRLTKSLVDMTEDTSLILEFPDYVCQEIINELTMLVMARTSDPRFQTLAVNQSIANPQSAESDLSAKQS